MRRLILSILTLVVVGDLVVGCASWRELKDGADKGGEMGAPFGPWGKIVGAGVGVALAAVGVRAKERTKLKRTHAGERSKLELRIRELEQRLDNARAQPSREG